MLCVKDILETIFFETFRNNQISVSAMQRVIVGHFPFWKECKLLLVYENSGYKN